MVLMKKIEAEETKERRRKGSDEATRKTQSSDNVLRLRNEGWRRRRKRRRGEGKESRRRNMRRRTRRGKRKTKQKMDDEGTVEILRVRKCIRG